MLPNPSITPIPNNEPDAVPSLWNVRYQEIDENFDNLDNRAEAIESEIEAAAPESRTCPRRSTPSLPRSAAFPAP